MNQHTNPFAYFIERERAAGHHARLPESPKPPTQHSRTQARVLEYIKAHGGANGRDMAADMKLTAHQVSTAIDCLAHGKAIAKTGRRDRGWIIWEACQ